MPCVLIGLVMKLVVIVTELCVSGAICYCPSLYTTYPKLTRPQITIYFTTAALAGWSPSYRVCLIVVYVLATSKVMSGWVPTCAHSWQLCSGISAHNVLISHSVTLS